MPTPSGESALSRTIESDTTPRTHLPSPPQSPDYVRTGREYLGDGVANNTARGMAETQEQSMYWDHTTSTSEGLCGGDAEKLNSSQRAVEDVTTEEGVAPAPAPSQDAGAAEIGTRQTDDNARDTPATPSYQVPNTETSIEESIPALDPSKSTLLSPSRTVSEELFTPSPPVASASSSDRESVPGTTTSDSMQCLTSDFTKVRINPSFTSSFFRPGSRFIGTQQSDRQIYNVDVEILNVSIPDSAVSGYLKICGLTDTHPTLTTYFEGEIIGTKHTFQTRHASWGATDKTDMQHWARFPAWRPLAKEARKPGFSFGKGWWNREHVFMRWKEHFLVPDHRVRNIQGASFEGFYYICFNQIEGKISGIYFHAKSENSGINDRYQQLELEHVPNKGCLGAMEFR